MRNFRDISLLWLITGFALLHFATALLCRVTGIQDSMLLTLLTMLMTVIICLRGGLSLEFTAISVILVNIFGYALGMGIQQLLRPVLGLGMLNPATSTFITTGLVGFTLRGLVRVFEAEGGKERPVLNVNWLVLAVAVIFIVRIGLTLVFSSGLFSEQMVSDVFSDLAGNSLALLLMIIANILWMLHNIPSRTKLNLSVLDAALLFLLLCVGCSLITGLGLPFNYQKDLSLKYFTELLIISLIVQVAIFSITYIIFYGFHARRRMEQEKERANKASMQYATLKQLVNPHFLFNSLNVLDALVTEGNKEAASEYINKLAGIYRHMLQTEDRTLVTLRDEMTYVRMFVDLQKVRFQEGLEVSEDIREADLDRFVVPCSVQLLVENATKHNTTSKASPLRVSIASDPEWVEVRNDLHPRLTPVRSTGLGLNYVRQQYLDNGGREVRIISTEKEYIVKLPLL